MGQRGRVVVVVGASRGIGRAVAYRLARRGDRLVVVARDEEALARTAEHCRALGAQVLAVPADVTDSDALGSVVRSAVERFGRIDVWIGVTGVLAYGTVEQTPTAVYRRVLETNLIAQIDGVRRVLPVFRAQGSGRIILIGSLYSRVTAPYVSAYAASKFGLLGFAGSLRQELLDARGIDVRVIIPATIDTAVYQRAANLTGRVPRPIPPVVSPFRVARAVERSTRGRGAPVMSVGRVQSALIPFSAAFPRVFDHVVRLSMETLGLTRRPADDTLGTLDRPHHDVGSVTGGWRSPGLRAGLVAMTLAGAAALAGRRRRE